ncbi:MAG: PspC domain-containing protein [Chloroflexi bacterium]|nr:PspC domain-containing protein [Chloroflexota bacterium]
MSPEIPSPQSPSPPPPPPYAPPPHRRLVRSTRERMWAGVCGGMAEYFDLDPSLVRILWIAATIASGGIGVALYILAWVLMPRDDRPPMQTGEYQWRDWSQEFHNETQRLAEEARRMAGEVGHPWQEPTPRDPATDKGTTPAPAPTTPMPPTTTPQQDWWSSGRYVEPHRHHGRNPRTMGVLLVGAGVLLLAANAGIFSWIEWRTMWPLIFIGLGLLLLAKQADLGR